MAESNMVSKYAKPSSKSAKLRTARYASIWADLEDLEQPRSLHCDAHICLWWALEVVAATGHIMLS